MNDSRCVITIACGRPVYYEMAATLARSFRRHNRGSGIEFVLAVDDPERVASDVAQWARVVTITEQDVEGFEYKLLIDRYARSDQVLFIDADCLVVGALKAVFDRWEGRAFVAVGDNRSEGEWFGSIASRCSALKVASIPVFVGAVYYFNRHLEGEKVVALARANAPKYDELGIIRLRGKRNEEPLISMAMASYACAAVVDEATVKADAMCFFGPIRVDVLRGLAEFESPDYGHKLAPLVGERASPLIAHFNDSYADGWLYQRESLILALTSRSRLPLWVVRPWARLSIELPGRLGEACRDLLRPAHRRVFGARKIRVSNRV